MKKIYALLSFLLMTGFASAQFSSDSTLNYAIHDLAGSEQSVPLTAATSNGNTYVSWFDISSGQYNLKMQLLDIDGMPLWGQGGIVISSYPQNSAIFRYDLEVDHENNAIVAFQDERTGTLQVVAYKITPTGLSAWGNGIVLQDSTSDGLSPRITTTASNDVIIAWNASLGSSKWVAYAKLSAAGQLQWIKRIWNNQKYSRAVMLPAGATGFQMLYVQETGNFPGVTCTMYLQRFDSSGTAQWPVPVQASTKTISFFFFPEIISDGQDGIYIAFNTGHPSNPMMNDVYAQHVDSAGVTWSATGTECANSATEHKTVGGFTTNTAGTELYVALQVLNSSQSNSGISLQRLDAAGNNLLGANAMTLRPISASYYLPVGIVDEQNGVMIVYVLGGFGAQTIHGLKTDYNGLALWGYDPTVSAALSNKDDVSCGPFANGQSVVVWFDDRIGGGIYAQNVLANGGFGPHVGMEEQQFVREPILFPNPSAVPKIQLVSGGSQEVLIRITSVTGHLLSEYPARLQQGVQEIPVKCSAPEGLYFVQILAGNQQLWCGKWMNR